MIVAEHLRKTFPGKGKGAGPVIAVDDVGFEARDGEITGLLGPNGAGKTTTLRMLYTLMKPDAGHVSVDGFDIVRDAEAVRRRLGVLPDARGIYKRLTARENIAYFGELHGMSKADIAMRTTPCTPINRNCLASCAHRSAGTTRWPLTAASTALSRLTMAGAAART